MYAIRRVVREAYQLTSGMASLALSVTRWPASERAWVPAEAACFVAFVPAAAVASAARLAAFELFGHIRLGTFD